MRHFHFHGTEASNQFHYYGRSQLRTLEVAQSLVQINTFVFSCQPLYSWVLNGFNEFSQQSFWPKMLSHKNAENAMVYGYSIYMSFIFMKKNLCNDFNTTCANSMPLIHTASLLLFVCNLSIKRLLSLLENQ